MRKDIAPFKLRYSYKDNRLRLWLYGIDNKHRVLVKKDKVHIILDAISEGYDIDIVSAIIDGDLDISDIADHLDRNKNDMPIIRSNIYIADSLVRGIMFGRTIFNGNVNFDDSSFLSGMIIYTDSIFNGITSFSGTIFTDNTSFMNTTFGNYVDFSMAIFRGNATFWRVIFNGDVFFTGTTFSYGAMFQGTTFRKRVIFIGSKMLFPGNFSYVKFNENTVLRGLWNTTFGRIKRLHCTVTDFSGFNTVTVMDGSSNPYLKRYIDDELWIQSWKERSWWRHHLLFPLWEFTSHCGRSFTLWILWALGFALTFAGIYKHFGPDNVTFNVTKLAEQQPSFISYLYYSIVTFTTLGFGDIVPLTDKARVAVGIEVLLGYIMLGGLLSIFANKFARRS